MTKWEYKSLIARVSASGPEIDLAKLGTEGWELVSVVAKTVTLTLPELTIKPGLGSQKVTAQQGAPMADVELIYVFKRPAG